MTRHPLPEMRTDNAEQTFFPSLQKEMNRLLDQFRNGFPTPDTHWPAGFGSDAFPAIDYVESDDAMHISAEVPGMSEDDIDVSITDKTLTLKGKKSAEHAADEDGVHVIERRYGSFRRQIPLGFTPDADAVEATFTDGILRLKITKPAETQAAVRKIAIKKS